MQIELNEKRAIVSGSTAGIGFAIAGAALRVGGGIVESVT